MEQRKLDSKDSTGASQPRALDDVTSSVDHLWLAKKTGICHSASPTHNLLKFVDSGSQREWSSVLPT